MPFLPSLSEDAKLGRIYATDPAYYLPLVEFSEYVMRGASPLSPGERELIAAYTSALNACGFCAGAHAGAAKAFGIGEGVIVALVDDIDAAPVDERLKPILRYVRKLTETPSRMVQADADAVYDAGWDEQALTHAINVSALFGYFNRVVDGHGLQSDPSVDEERGKVLAEMGYLGMHGPRLRKLLAEDAEPAVAD
jgi:uncharacterized peroxidase-related enzyme